MRQSKGDYYMKKNKKIYLFLILVLFFLYTLLIFPINVYANDNINDETIIEEKIYYQGTLDDNFNYDKIIVVLSKEETNKYKDYTSDDFPEIDCQSVTDLTQSIVNKIKNKEFNENKSLIIYFGTGASEDLVKVKNISIE